MALRFIDGFDQYTSSAIIRKYNEIGTSAYVTIADGRRTGSKALKLQSTSGSLTKTLDEQNTWIAGFAIYIATMPSSRSSIIQFRDNTSSPQSSLSLSTTGNIVLCRGSASGTALATSERALSVGSWHYLETKLVISDTVGFFEAKVDGEIWATFTGDTKYSSSLSTANHYILFGFPSAASVYYDDFYICDGSGSVNNEYLGDCRIDTLFPTGAGTSAQFTPTGSAANWENLDEVPPDDDTSYNASGTVGALDSFPVTDLSALNADIFGIQMNLLAKKDDAGERSLVSLVRCGGTDMAGDPVFLGNSYLNLTTVFEQNPATSANWTEAEINVAEFGYRVQS